MSSIMVVVGGGMELLIPSSVQVSDNRYLVIVHEVVAVDVDSWRCSGLGMSGRGSD